MFIPFPEFPKAKVFIGGCVKRGEGSSFRASAHAHIADKDEHKGTICVRSKNPDALRLTDGTPTNLMKHEYAHILVSEGHTKKYWTMLSQLGGYMERESYFGHKKKDFIKLRTDWETVKNKVANSISPY